MFRGKVKWFDHKKGYGFIVPDAGGPDIFVHATALKSSNINEIEEGDLLVYDVEKNKRSGKPCASNVRFA